MNRGGDAGATKEVESTAENGRREFDQAQLDPTMQAACMAALDMLRACAAAHGANPPSLQARAATARAAMSAIGQHWQALVRAAE